MSWSSPCSLSPVADLPQLGHTFVGSNRCWYRDKRFAGCKANLLRDSQSSNASSRCYCISRATKLVTSTLKVASLSLSSSPSRLKTDGGSLESRQHCQRTTRRCILVVVTGKDNHTTTASTRYYSVVNWTERWKGAVIGTKGAAVLLSRRWQEPRDRMQIGITYLPLSWEVNYGVLNLWTELDWRALVWVNFF